MALTGGVLACGGPRAAPQPPAIANVAGLADEEGEPPEPVTVAEDACVSACLDEHAGEGGPDDGLRGYCEERCAPVEGPNSDCVDSCIASKEPGAYYDDDGEYQRYEETRTEEEIAADAEACEEACEDVPTVSGAALEACVAHCEHPEPYCYERCDPDPYDACRYAPCD